MNLDKSSIESIVREVVERRLGADAGSQPGNGEPVCDLPNAGAFKDKLSRDEPAFGVWLTLEAPSITEMACRMGFDWIVIDAEHGYLDMKNVMEHIRVANLSNTTILVRIAEIQEGLIKRIMDIGADGIVVPQVRTAEQVATAVRYAKYPPEGLRGIGAERATRWGQGIEQCVPRANQNSLVVPMMETVDAGESIDQILDVPGVDAMFFSGVKTREQLEFLSARLRIPIFLGNTPEELADFDFLSTNKVRIALQGHLPFMAGVKSVYDTLKLLKDGTTPAELSDAYSPDLVKMFTRTEDYQHWMDKYLSK